MHHARFILFAVQSLLLPTLALAQYSSPPEKGKPCTDCGVILEIREIAIKRELANTPGNSPLQDERSPPAQPMIRIPLTNRPEANVPKLDVYGSRSMRKQLEDSVYEVVIRYDDGRFTRIEVPAVGQLYVGARVRVYQNRIEMYYRE